MTKSDTDTETDWENVSSLSSSDDNSDSPTKTSEASMPQNESPGAINTIKPWSPDSIGGIISEEETPASLNEEKAALFMETEERANEYITALRSDEEHEIRGDGVFEKIFDFVRTEFKQFGFDIKRPIVIEFESLFITALTGHIGSNLTKTSFQSLPLVFAAEKFLARLSSSGNLLEIHAFSAFEPFWPTPAVRLARAALLRHLAHAQTPSLRVRAFGHFLSPQWESSRALVRPAAVLVACGTALRFNDVTRPAPGLLPLLKKLALFALAEDVPVYRIEELFYHSNAIFGNEYGLFPETRRLLAEERRFWAFRGKIGENGDKNDENGDKNDENGDKNDENGEKIGEIRCALKGSDAVMGETAFVFAVAECLNNVRWSDEASRGAAAVVDSKVLILCRLLQSKLPMECRRLSASFGESDNFEFFNAIAEQILKIFSELNSGELENVCDYIDLRLFAVVKSAISSNSDAEKSLVDKLDNEINTIWGFLSQNVPVLAGQSFSPVGNEKTVVAEPLQIKNPDKTETHSLYKITSKMMSKFTDEIDDFLIENRLCYDNDKSHGNDALHKSFYICDELEADMNLFHVMKNNDVLAKYMPDAKYIFHMKKYAESLASPKIVLRDVMVEIAGESEKSQKSQKLPENGEKALKKGVKGKKGQNKKKTKNTITEKIFEQNRLKNIAKQKDDLLSFIEQALRALPLKKKIESLDEKLLPIQNPVIALPAQIQLLEWLKEFYKKSDPRKDIEPATFLFRNVYDIYRRFHNHLTVGQFEKLQSALMMMGFHSETKKLVEVFNKSRGNALAKLIEFTKDIYCVPVGMNCVRFQLQYTGPFMVRSIQSQEDPRVVGFFPDDWQRNLLDAVDRRESCLVVAPTSSGKTFISYYAMKRVLEVNKTVERSSERGLVVFVCPSKALVNQVSADIYARYGEIFGVLTKDYSQFVLSCQVLITLPESFEKILLSPPFEQFVKRIKYVIMDEIHTIGDSLGGEVWERIILLIQCPFIALSATLGNPDVFHGWLSSVSQAFEFEKEKDDFERPKVNLIEFYERWSDLEKYIYIPKNAPNPVITAAEIEPDYCDAKSSLVPINPLAAFKLGVCTKDNFFLPNIDMTSNECLEAYDVIIRTAKEAEEPLRSTVLSEMSEFEPETYFSSLCITKNEVTIYGKALKSKLNEWHRRGLWDFIDQTLTALATPLKTRIAAMDAQRPARAETPAHAAAPAPFPAALPHTTSAATPYAGPYTDDFVLRQVVPLLLELRNRRDLPALVFVRDQALCDAAALETLRFLETSEAAALSEGDRKARQRARKQAAKEIKQWKRVRDRIDKRQEEALLKEGAIPDVARDLDAGEADARFSFVGPGEGPDEDDIEYWVRRTLRKNNWARSHPFLRCIDRGVAVHHVGMSHIYRTLVEVLVRARHVKVVLTVGTLALGVNLPCRTTVFAGDTSELTPLRYRQMMGRAGRRGYDNVGKVIFIGVPPHKISYLMTSSLYSLHGHQTMTITTFLRNLVCLAETSDKTFRLRSFAKMMKPTFGTTKVDFSAVPPTEAKLLYRFSMEFLYQNNLIDRSLLPTGLAGLVSSLYALEPANFAFALLLDAGAFDNIAIRLNANPQRTLQDETMAGVALLEILAHLFFRVPLPSGFRRPAQSVSQLVLAPLKPAARAVVAGFNGSTAALFAQFFRLSAERQKGRGEAERLPLSGRAAADGAWAAEGAAEVLFGAAEAGDGARSGFAAMAGAGRAPFRSGLELQETARGGRGFEKSDSVPVVEDKGSDGGDLELSAYVIDFFRQGSLSQLLKESCLGELHAWTLLKSWSVTLLAIKDSLAQLAQKVPTAAGEVCPRLYLNAASCLPAFESLSDLFQTHFRSIREIVEYNYE